MTREEILTYIHSSETVGKSKEQIYTELLQQGLTIASIDEAFISRTQLSTPEDTHKKAVTFIVYLGALLIGVGIFSFVASNWNGIDKIAKVLIIIAAMIGAYAGGYFVKEKRHLDKTGEAAYLLGNIIYGAGIFLIAQMFHIQADWPDGFILWMIGSLIAGYAFSSRAVYFVAIIVGVFAVVSIPSSLLSQSSYAYNPQVVSSAFLLIVAIIVCGLLGYLVRRSIPPSYFIDKS